MGGAAFSAGELRTRSFAFKIAKGNPCTESADPLNTWRGCEPGAKKHGHMPHVARVRHLNDKLKPDHWRVA